jgi:outer membrane lipoprotein LolB
MLIVCFMPWTSFAFRSLKSGICLLIMPFILIGCATVISPSAPDTAVAAQAAPRPYHETITIGGRLSVRYQQNARDEVIHGSFTWVQRADNTVVTLFSPLGQTIAIIEITPALSTLTQAGQAPRTADNVDALVAGTLGWPLPVSGLRDWLQGFAMDTEGRRFVASPLPDANNVTTRDGWRLHYPIWQDDAGQSRPKRIDLERSTAQAGDVAIRIVIDTWQPG